MTQVRLPDGSTQPMSDAWRARIAEQFEEMARRPLRCLGLAIKEVRLASISFRSPLDLP